MTFHLETTVLTRQLDGERVAYAMLTLQELARRIAIGRDAEALNELLQRTLFYVYRAGLVCLVDFIDHLRRQALDRFNSYADQAYDLTIDKFSRLRSNEAPLAREDPSRPDAGKAGADCRGYFHAFVQHLDGRQSELARLTALEREMAEAKALQGFVSRHFVLSLRECQRSFFMTRYAWRRAGGSLTVLMPRTISGRARRQWLETNVPDADPTRTNEAARVQAIIDVRIGQARFFVLCEDRQLDLDAPLVNPLPIPGEEVSSVSVEGLADTVAKEKAANIQAQRPAIRALGPAKLREMIRRIFDDLADDRYCLTEVAQQYGLSKATLSRFAGIRWGPRQRRMGTSIPDLYRNMAQVVGSDADFVEAAKRAGVWQGIEEIFDRSLQMVV